MLLSEIQPKLYSAVQEAVFNTFAYRLGPDEWDVAEEDFRQNLQSAIASQQADSADAICDHDRKHFPMKPGGFFKCKKCSETRR